MERQKQTFGLCLEFSKFEENFGDVICVTCILCVGMVEILDLQLRYNFG
jgi:hypothetical protein